jgi:hypothetical protein
MDDADKAADYQEQLNATAHRAHSMPDKAANGKCVWCDEPIKLGSFCINNGCAEDWEKWIKRNR